MPDSWRPFGPGDSIWGTMEVHTWVMYHKYLEVPTVESINLRNMLRAMNDFFGGYPKDHTAYKNLLWKVCNDDIKKNGAVCSGCMSRWHPNGYQNRLLCNVCIEERIEWLADEVDERHYVYALYTDGESEPQYIGVTKNPRTRFVDHWVEKNIGSMRVMTGFDDRSRAEECERQLIWEWQPPLNKRIAPPTMDNMLPDSWFRKVVDSASESVDGVTEQAETTVAASAE